MKKKYIVNFTFFLLVLTSFIVLAGCPENNPVLDKITVTQNPTKTIYSLNEEFNPDGLVVTAFYSDGSSKPVSGYTLSKPDMSTVGTKTITVIYEGETAVFTISVTDTLLENPDGGNLGVTVY